MMGKEHKARKNFQIPEMSQAPQRAAEEVAFSFEIAPAVKSPSTHARRGPAGVTIQPSGLSDSNMNCADLLRELVGANPKVDEGTFCTALGGDPERGVVGVFAVSEGTEGAMPVRRNVDGTYTLYLHGVFEKHPQLRPSGARDCAVTRRTDKHGKACLVINLHGGLVRRTTPRGSSGGAAANGDAEWGK
jgi:hypothetical protein